MNKILDMFRRKKTHNILAAGFCIVVLSIILELIFTKRVAFRECGFLFADMSKYLVWNKLLVICVMVTAVFIAVFYVRKHIDENNRLSISETIFLVGLFIYLLLWATRYDLNFAPDEGMRYDVSLFMFQNNRIPKYEETSNWLWGFSYSHIPTMLCNLLSYIPMKIVGMFSDNDFAIVVAARMVSVLCGVGAGYFSIKTAKLLFPNCFKWVLVCTITLLPQFDFLCSYVNNDIVAFLGVSIIIYTWIYALKTEWNEKKAVLLGIGISICVLSYYNSYGWVLISIIFAVVSYFLCNKQDVKYLYKLIGIVAVVACVLCSFIFIRHLVLYNDLLGFKTSKEYGELYAMEGYRSSQRITLKDLGYTMGEMVTDTVWFEYTCKSFVLAFGYMAYWAYGAVYWFYWLLGLVGIGAFVVFAAPKGIQIIVGKNKDYKSLLLYMCLFAGFCISVFLAMRYNYSHDFTPQGRYCITALWTIAVFMAKGYEKLCEKINCKNKNIVAMSIVGMLLAMSYTQFYTLYMILE